jgi:hypothetical protein
MVLIRKSQLSSVRGGNRRKGRWLFSKGRQTLAGSEAGDGRNVSRRREG